MQKAFSPWLHLLTLFVITTQYSCADWTFDPQTANVMQLDSATATVESTDGFSSEQAPSYENDVMGEEGALLVQSERSSCTGAEQTTPVGKRRARRDGKPLLCTPSDNPNQLSNDGKAPTAEQGQQQKPGPAIYPPNSGEPLIPIFRPQTSWPKPNKNICWVSTHPTPVCGKYRNAYAANTLLREFNVDNAEPLIDGLSCRVSEAFWCCRDFRLSWRKAEPYEDVQRLVDLPDQKFRVALDNVLNNPFKFVGILCILYGSQPGSG